MRVISDINSSGSLWKTILSSKGCWILLIALLAMGGALRTDFYMDDLAFILNSKGDGLGNFYWTFLGQRYGSDSPDAMGITVFQLIPTLMTLLTNGLFPLDSAAAHVWNLGIHLGLALLIYRVGLRLLGRLEVFNSPAARRQAAFIGALVFACHPLGTEPVHYAKCHMVQLVALFSFWATAEALEFLHAPARRQAIRFLLVAGLCVISYFPGTVLMGINIMLAVIWTWKKGALPPLKAGISDFKNRRTVMGLMGAALAVSYLGYYFLHRYYVTLTSWGDMYPVHVVTQGRVFWEYMIRIIIPTGLASDHFQHWSTFRDTGAVIKLAGFALLFLTMLVLAIKKGSPARRGLCLMGLFVLIPFAIRLLYVNIEIMVEYRAYHALPWFGLLAGVGFVALAQRISSPSLRWVPAAAVILVFTVLSADRGRVWQSPIALAENVLEQYPLNNRARTQLQSYDLDAGNFRAVLARHEEILTVRDSIETLNSATQGRISIDPMRADSNIIGSYQFAVLARAELEGCQRALAFADHAIAHLETLLPGQFKLRPGETINGAWPLLEAKASVERAQAAGYIPVALQPN